MTAPAPGSPIDGLTLRKLLGNFCSGITVITGGTRELGPEGFTCQSFSSLSLEPPLVTFSPSRTSTTWPKLREHGRFCVNILADDQHHLSQRFATSGIDKFSGVDWSPGRHGSPVLDGVVAWIECDLWAEYDGGDHTIVVGRITAFGADTFRQPLLFHRGDYKLLLDDVFSRAHG